MTPTPRSKTRNSAPDTPLTAPEQKDVKMPATAKKPNQKKTTKDPIALKRSKKKVDPDAGAETEIKMESDQSSESQAPSIADTQPDVKPEPIERPAKKRGRKPKAESAVKIEQPSASEAPSVNDSQPETSTTPKNESIAESSQPNSSHASAEGASVVNMDSDSEENTKAKKKAKTTKEPKPKKELKPKKEPKTKKEPKPKKVVKPKVNKKEVRRKIKASEIPGFSSLRQDMQSRVVRVLLQRIFVLSRSQDDESRETFEIIGSTGSTYTVKISDHMSCSCIDYRFKRLHCKHILTVLLKVYRLHFSNRLFKSLNTSYEDRKAAINNNRVMVDPSVLVSSEVRDKIMDVMTNKPKGASTQMAEQRPLDTSDCPVCFEAFEPENIDFISYCYTCGNNIHKECLEQWVRSKGGLQRATCVYCRSPWVEPDQTPSIKSWRQVDEDHRDGTYVNFAEEIGLNRTRDQSTYGTNYLKFIE